MEPTSNRESILSRFMDGPGELERALAGLSDDDLDAAPDGGGWTIRQIVHHLADGDDIWKVGIKAALGNEESEFRLDWYWTMPQKDWADCWKYSQRSLDTSLALLRASRSHIQQLLESIPDGWDRAINVPTRDGNVERVTVGAIVEMQTDHVVHHVRRILEIRRERHRA